VGSGKSTFLKTLTVLLKKLDWSLSSLSSDALRKELVDKYREKNPGVEEREAFDKTAKTATIEFNRRLEKLVGDADKPSNKPVHVIFVDKNHPPNALDKTIKSVKEKAPQGSKVRCLYMVPRILQKPVPGYPFSASFFMQCFYRIMKRDEHETLSNSDPVLAVSVLFMFFKFYFKEGLNSTFLADHELDGFMEVPLTVEDV
jgi:hypothetical protein